MKLSKYIVLCFASSFFYPGSLVAQGQSFKDQVNRVDVFFGLGAGLSKESLAINLGSELQTKFGLLQFRVNGIREGIQVLPEEEPIESILDVSLLYGWRINLDKSNDNTLSILIGIGEVSSIKRGELLSEGSNFGPRKFEKIENRGIGLSYEVSFSSRENKLGAKIAITGNINEIESYSGLTAGFILRLF